VFLFGTFFGNFFGEVVWWFACLNMLKRFFHFLLFLIRGGPARVAFETKNNCSESGQTMTEFLHQSVKTCNARLVCCYSGAQPKPSNTAAARTFLTVPGAKNLYEPN